MTEAEAQEIIEMLAGFEKDPLGFALWAFPWGEPGTPLENEKLEDWQVEALDYIGKELRAGRNVIRLARSTGHGVGKSALASIITWWAESTMVDTKGIVTANTENQLKTKTWPEINKWHRMFIARDLFDVRATAIFPRDDETNRTWRIDIVPWSENNTEAFAGMHNFGRRILVLMDEASAIPDVIHEVTEGALTDEDTQIIWIQFGNPTRNSGRFRETAPDGRFGRRWNFRALDSRSVSRTNKTLIEEWKEDYGEDSDFFRVRVKGMFPRSDAISFISWELAKEASQRELPEINHAHYILGVDVARQGDDKSCIYPRRGRDGRSTAPEIYQGLDTVALAFKVRDAVLRYRPVAVCVDGTGIGAGVVDRLNEMRLGVLVYEVQFGAKPDGDVDEKTANKRAEIWLKMRHWLKTGCISEYIRGLDRTSIEELTGPTYGFNAQDAIQLESKKDMKRRGVPSPDIADALACTFAITVPEVTLDRFGRSVEEKPQIAPDYDPLENFNV